MGGGSTPGRNQQTACLSDKLKKAVLLGMVLKTGSLLWLLAEQLCPVLQLLTS